MVPDTKHLIKRLEFSTKKQSLKKKVTPAVGLNMHPTPTGIEADAFESAIDQEDIMQNELSSTSMNLEEF